MKHLLLPMCLVVLLTCCINESTPATTSTIPIEKGNRHAVIETERGNITILLYEDKMPITTKNFINLAEEGFYDNLTFHRVEKNFVIQGGDPKGDGTGGSNKTIPLEIAPSLRHDKGMVGMARKPHKTNSATSQFYITLRKAYNLDGGYAVFGKVVDGMDVVEKIEKGDRMLKVVIK